MLACIDRFLSLPNPGSVDLVRYPYQPSFFARPAKYLASLNRFGGLLPISHLPIKVKESTEHLSGGIEYPDRIRVWPLDSLQRLRPLSDKGVRNSLGYVVELMKQAKAQLSEEYIRSVADLIAITGRRTNYVTRSGKLYRFEYNSFLNGRS
ncbi:hypothetical protein LWI28_007356 [Acer negundo]|uniref:Uncharacterized protein n=1 Tax=Acer negundo TaxID=4023 RepID=A0AAD5J8N6_ACENE|nr:hypothetical protein LWI28_007356 [Acer negundo]